MGGNEGEADGVGWREDLHVGPEHLPHYLLDVPPGGGKGGTGQEEISKEERRDSLDNSERKQGWKYAPPLHSPAKDIA